jgi:uncharacterized repeat protein (TIGR01451 family)
MNSPRSFLCLTLCFLALLWVDSALAENVIEAWRVGGFANPHSLSVNPTDNTCWLADTEHDQVVHLAEDGTELWRGNGFSYPESVSVSPTDGSCWVADHGHDEVVHLAEDGTELWRGSFGADRVAVNSTDGSCWASGDGVIHLAEDGTYLSSSSSCPNVWFLAVNPEDGSCWAALFDRHEVVHLAEDGTELSRSGGFEAPRCVAVNPTDGSCWVAAAGVVLHLAEDGTEIWRGDDFGGPWGVSVNAMDGSCWVTDHGRHEVVHLAEDGTVLWRGDGFSQPWPVSVNPTDGSCWVADYGGQLARFLVVGYSPYPRTISFTSFEDDRAPWAAFAAGPDQAAIWRGVTGASPVHGGVHSMSADVSSQGIAGLRLALPTSPTAPVEYILRAWAYVDERSPTDASCFFGFALSEDYPGSARAWSQDLGWEVLSGSSSRYQLAGASYDESYGLPQAEWHLVEISYAPTTSQVSLSLDGLPVGSVEALAAGGQVARYAVLGALGQDAGARQYVHFDDVTVTLVGDVGLPLDVHISANVDGPEQVAESQQYPYTIQFGNGYPMLGMDPLEEELPQHMYVGLTVPSAYEFAGASPDPVAIASGNPVWELPVPVSGQESHVDLALRAPVEPANPFAERIWLWVTEGGTGAAPAPPSAPEWAAPYDPTWGCPADLLLQRVESDPVPDIWVHKVGPASASPGDTITYAITVGNSGLAAASDVLVRDQLPELLGDGDFVIGQIGQLAPDQTWSRDVSRELAWGVAAGTLLLNRAYVPSAPPEVEFGNNVAVCQTAVLAAHDPNCISVSPEGSVSPGDTLVYTVECENAGEGVAYGVYVTAFLDALLDDATLSLPSGISYDSHSRSLVWEVGILPPGEGCSLSYSVKVSSDAPVAEAIAAQAVVYFPSVPEETPTNVVVTKLWRLFPDVLSEHWAFGEVEACVAAGIVDGYPDGSYWPTLGVSRDQLAVYVARSLAGGDYAVPQGPDEPTFPDVPPDHWAYDSIEYGVANNVVQGYPDGHYMPEYEVSRDQMAVSLARAKGWITIGDDMTVAPELFADVPAGHWAGTAIEACVEHGLVKGYPDGLYHPGWEVTRDQMAVYIAGAFDLPV